MFASWRVDVTQTNSGTGRRFDAAEIMAAGKRSSSHSACNTCRAKKLKCSAEERGCLRCRSTRTVCTYPDQTITQARHRKKTGSRTTSRENTPVTTGNTRKSPPEVIMATPQSLDPQLEYRGEAEDDECWKNVSDQFPDWPFTDIADSTWSGTMTDSAIEYFQNDVSRLASLSSSDSHVVQSELLPPMERQTSSPEATTRTTENTGAMAGCRCLSRAALLLDQLNSPVITPLPSTTDQLIVSYRSGSRVLLDLHDCSLCSSRSEVMIILVMVLQGLLALCEQMVDRQASGIGSEDCELRFGQISVMTVAERDSLSHALISAQCRDFASLLDMYKTRAAWMPGSLALLRSMGSRLLYPGSDLELRFSSRHGN